MENPSAEVAVAATEGEKSGRGFAALMTAAMTLPGIAPAVSSAAPAAPGVGVEYFSYHEHGEGIDVDSPMAWGRFSPTAKSEVELIAVLDAVSGASPWFSSNQSGETVNTSTGASVFDGRRALDLKATYFFEGFDVSLGGAYSTEDDYESQAVRLETRWEFNKKNTVLTLGSGYVTDDISSNDDPDLQEEKHTRSFLVGITQLLSPVSLVQSNLTFNHGTGYFSDPYKIAFNLSSVTPFKEDTRPRQRDQWAWLTRYNHFFPHWESALHLDYRYYWDDWQVRAHTMDFAWYQPLGKGWTIRPNIRYYNQTAADFFADTVPETFGDEFSSDFRLGTFGSLAAGLKIIKTFDSGLTVSVRAESYRQSPDLTWENGSQIDSLYATTLAANVLYLF